MSGFDSTIFIGGLLIALVVGFLTGIFGIGGGFLTTPALIILLGVPAPIAVGTGVTMILATGSFAILKRRSSGTIDGKLALILAPASILGAFLGVRLVEVLKNMSALVILGRQHQAVRYIILCAFFLLIMGIGVFMFLDYRNTGGKRPDKRVGLFSKIKLPPYVNLPLLEQAKLPILPMVLLGIIVGMLQGSLGIGGGVIWLPALVYLVGQRTVKAVGTSLLIVWASSLFASGDHIAHGNINFLLLVAMLIGGLVSVHYGTKAGLKLAGPKLRLYFVYVLIAATLLIAYELFSTTFLK